MTKIVTEKECLEFGGHCFESTGEILTSNPPQYPEVCKHCNKRRVGILQELMKYYGT